jgi:hypothetical protein
MIEFKDLAQRLRKSLAELQASLKPIEQLFAKLKAMLRSAAARTKDAVWSAIGQALEAFSCRANVPASITRSRRSWLYAHAILASTPSRQRTRAFQPRRESRA